jgi:ABC-type spermidine/putrescine transport system permease subunit II
VPPAELDTRGTELEAVVARTPALPTVRAERPTTVARPRALRAVWRVAALLFAAVMVAPLLCVLLYSFADRFSVTAALPPAYSLRWYRLFFDTPRAVTALETSLILASASTALALAAGLPACRALVRRLPGRGAIEGLILLRAAVPVIVLGLGTAAVLYQFHAVDRWPSVILAHGAGGLPFVIWAVRPAMAGLDPDLEAAARDLGAGPVRRFWLASRAVFPAVIAGALFAFLFSMDEFAVTFLIAGQHIETLPLLLYGTLESNSVQAAAAVAVALLVPSAVIAGSAAWLLTKVEALPGMQRRMA